MLGTHSKKVILIHGWCGDPNDGWYAWLKTELIKRGFEVIAPQMPNPLVPIYQDWLRVALTLRDQIDENTYFVGHSVGCMTIIQLLQTLPDNQKIGGAVFVSGFCSVPNIPLVDEFCAGPIDWEKIRARSHNYVCILSDNDHFVPMYIGEEFASKLDANMIIEKGKGHFAHLAGIFKLPSALSSVLLISGRL